MYRPNSRNYGNHRAPQYVAYNDPGEVNSVDLNRWYRPDDPRVKMGSGRLLYAVEPRVPSYFACSPDKDIELSYILGVDRDDHPDHASHFGFGRCPNGYCFGNMPGKYIVPTAVSCHDPQPQNMAPARFYEEEMLHPYSVHSQAIEDYKMAKDYHTFGWYPITSIKQLAGK